MDWAQIIIQLGVAGFALFILWKTSERHSKQIDERERAFREYAGEHNHRMTDLVTESTQAIKESTRAIKESSSLICTAAKTMESLHARIIKENTARK